MSWTCIAFSFSQFFDFKSCSNLSLSLGAFWSVLIFNLECFLQSSYFLDQSLLDIPYLLYISACSYAVTSVRLCLILMISILFHPHKQLTDWLLDCRVSVCYISAHQPYYYCSNY
jgi:hypothetical protein